MSSNRFFNSKIWDLLSINLKQSYEVVSKLLINRSKKEELLVESKKKLCIKNLRKRGEISFTKNINQIYSSEWAEEY